MTSNTVEGPCITQWNIVSVEAIYHVVQILVSFCGGGNFFQSTHWYIAAFLPRVYHVSCIPNTTSLSFSSDVASRRLLSNKTLKGYEYRAEKCSGQSCSCYGSYATAYMQPMYAITNTSHMVPHKHCYYHSNRKGNVSALQYSFL